MQRYLDYDLDHITTDHEIPDYKWYVMPIRPISNTEGKYLFGGMSYTLMGMEYGNLSYGYQFAIGAIRENSIKYRALIDGVWNDWKTLSFK